MTVTVITVSVMMLAWQPPSQSDLPPLTGQSPVSVSEERRGLGGPLSRQAGATLRPVTVWLLPPSHHITAGLYQEINKPFLSWNVFKTYCLYYSSSLAS